MAEIEQPHGNSPDRRFDVPLTEVSSQLIRKFHEHWLQLAQAGKLPKRGDIDPVDFRWALPNIILSAIERDPFRVHYRLCGERVTEFCGNLTGRYLDELGDPDLWSSGVYVRQYQTVVNEKRPVFSFDWMEAEDGSRRFFQTGIWPLASDGTNPDMCVAVEDYLNLQRYDLKPAPDRSPR
jgi:hypothetical protein